jgi:hypothetical protein
MHFVTPSELWCSVHGPLLDHSHTFKWSTSQVLQQFHVTSSLDKTMLVYDSHGLLSVARQYTTYRHRNVLPKSVRTCLRSSPLKKPFHPGTNFNTGSTIVLPDVILFVFCGRQEGNKFCFVFYSVPPPFPSVPLNNNIVITNECFCFVCLSHRLLEDFIFWFGKVWSWHNVWSQNEVRLHTV